MQHTKKRVGTIQALLLVTLSGTVAFSLGIRSAEDGQSVIDPILASDSVQGDINCDGALNDKDLDLAIDITLGLEDENIECPKNDQDEDGRITKKDYLWIRDHLRNAEGKRIRSK